MTDPRPLSPREAADLLDAMRAQIHSELSTLPEEVLAWHPAPGEWCVKEVVGHLIEAERRGFNGRVRQMQREQNPALTGWDPPTVAAARRDCERNGVEILAEFDAIRRDSVRLVAGLSEEDLRRTAQHPIVGTLSVADIVYEWVFHDRNHVRQLLANVQAYVWPHMGNTQRFTTG